MSNCRSHVSLAWETALAICAAFICIKHCSPGAQSPVSSSESRRVSSDRFKAACSPRSSFQLLQVYAHAPKGPHTPPPPPLPHLPGTLISRICLGFLRDSPRFSTGFVCERVCADRRHVSSGSLAHEFNYISAPAYTSFDISRSKTWPLYGFFVVFFRRKRAATHFSHVLQISVACWLCILTAMWNTEVPRRDLCIFFHCTLSI